MSKVTSLADLILLWGAPVCLISSPEKGLNGEFVMDVCETLPQKMKDGFEDKFSVGVDFRGSAGNKFVKDCIRWNDNGVVIRGEGDFARDYAVEPDKKAAERLAIENSFWFCFWKGKVSGGLAQLCIHTGDKKLPDFGSHMTKLNVDLGGQYGQQAYFINGFPGKDQCRVIVAASIDGGPVTQVEALHIPEITSDVTADLMRRCYGWAGRLHIIWARFPTLKDLLESLQGIRKLKESTTNDRIYTCTADEDPREPRCPTLLREPVEKILGTAHQSPSGNLIKAAFVGDIETIKYILKKGGDVNIRCGYGFSIASGAARSGHSEILQHIIHAKASPATLNAKDCDSNCPIGLAVAKGDLKCVQLLLDQPDVKTDVNSWECPTLKAKSEQQQYAEITQLLTQYGL